MPINNAIQRESNLSQIFETVWKEGEISRIELSKKLGVYRSTITNIIDLLIKNKIIIEGERGSVSEKGGRKPISLLINKEAGVIIGMELQVDFCSINVINLCGNTVYAKKHPVEFKVNLKETSQNEAKFDAIIEKFVKPEIDELKKQGVRIFGICLAVPGIVNSEKGIIVKSVPFGLSDYDFAGKLFYKYKIPFLIENDAKCCSWLNCLNSEEDFICVLMCNHDRGDIGVGLSVCVNGNILTGKNFAVGEYRSLSWKDEKNGQTGLSKNIIRKISYDKDAYKAWIIDLFSTLTVFIPLLGPGKIYFYGLKDDENQKIKKIIHSRVPQFEEALKVFNTKTIIPSGTGQEISRGAALMFIQRLFRIPYKEDYYFKDRLTWEKVFEG